MTTYSCVHPLSNPNCTTSNSDLCRSVVSKAQCDSSRPHGAGEDGLLFRTRKSTLPRTAVDRGRKNRGHMWMTSMSPAARQETLISSQVCCSATSSGARSSIDRLSNRGLLTALSSSAVKMSVSWLRNGSIMRRTNGKAIAITDDFTAHNAAKQRSWMMVNKCIRHVRTWKSWKCESILSNGMSWSNRKRILW